MITFEDAMRIAGEYLADSDVPLQITHQEEFSEGWFFCFQSKEYLETGKFAAQLVGNGPFLIDKDSGELHVMGTDRPVKEYLDEYLRKKRGKA